MLEKVAFKPLKEVIFILTVDSCQGGAAQLTQHLGVRPHNRVPRVKPVLTAIVIDPYFKDFWL